MEYKILKNFSDAEISQIAHIHKSAYSDKHLTSRFPINKLIEYNRCLLGSSDVCVVALDRNQKIQGFIIAGTSVSKGVLMFKKRNFWWLFYLLSKNPFILSEKVYEYVRHLLFKSTETKAKFRLLSIATDNKLQSKSIGVSMLAFFENELIKRGITMYGLSVKVTNRRAVKFYEKNGFQLESKSCGSYYYKKTIG